MTGDNNRSLSSKSARCFTAFKIAAEVASISSDCLPVMMLPSCNSKATADNIPEVFALFLAAATHFLSSSVKFKFLIMSSARWKIG